MHSNRAKKLAEEVGFEPTMDYSIPVFKTGAFVHSAIPPDRGSGVRSQAGCIVPQGNYAGND